MAMNFIIDSASRVSALFLFQKGYCANNSLTNLTTQKSHLNVAFTDMQYLYICDDS